MSKARHKARSRAVQAVYQWQLTGQDVREVEEYFLNEQDMNKADVTFFQQLLRGVISMYGELDQQISPLLDRPLDEVDPVEKAVLRLGAYELAERIDVPYRVVINEAVEMAKLFGAQDGHKYINGIMDKLAQHYRAVEVQARAR